MNPFLAIATDHACLVKKAGAAPIFDIGTWLQKRKQQAGVASREAQIGRAIDSQAMPLMRKKFQHEISGELFDANREIASKFALPPYRIGAEAPLRQIEHAFAKKPGIAPAASAAIASRALLTPNLWPAPHIGAADNMALPERLREFNKFSFGR